jgi:hypothetical protein
MDRHGPPERGESSEHARTADSSPAHTPSLPGGAHPADRILALQRTYGNAAVTALIAREGYAPKELPRLTRPVSEDFVSDFSKTKSSWLSYLENTLRIKAAVGFATAEDLHQLDLATAELHTRRSALERQLRRMKPELKAALERDDEQVRVTVEEILITRPDPLMYSVFAKVEIGRKMRTGYGGAMTEGPPIVFSRRNKTIHILDANFGLGTFEFPEAGLISEGLGPLEFLSVGRLALSLGKLGLKQTGKWLTKRAAGKSAGTMTGAAATAGATEAVEVGTTAISLRLMQHRTVALERAKAAGAQLDAKAFGNVIDDEFKALVRADIDAGRLPSRLQVAGRFQRGADVWDPQSRIGWDLTTATTRQVAGHDLRYLLGMGGKGPKTMHDGTQLVDVLPLVYSRSW